MHQVRQTPDIDRSFKAFELVAATLVGFGLVMVYSSSGVERCAGDEAFFLRKQFAWIMISFAGFLALRRLDYRRLQKLAWPILMLAIVLLVLVLVPGIGTKVNGARRWFRFGPIGLQVSDLAGLAVIIFLASHLSGDIRRNREYIYGFLTSSIALGVVAGLVLIEPNLSRAIIIGIIGLALMVAAGVRLCHIVPTMILTVPFALFGAYEKFGHVRDRVLSFMHGGDAQREGYQLAQSLRAFSEGGLTGKGLGQSTAKLSYLPEHFTDFIYAVVGEELGMAGAFFLLTLFILLAWFGFRLAERAPDAFGKLLGMGIVFSLTIQAALNVAVVLGAAPTTGISLPFISFGGSNMFFTGVGVGILANIARNSEDASFALLSEHLDMEAPRYAGAESVRSEAS